MFLLPWDTGEWTCTQWRRGQRNKCMGYFVIFLSSTIFTCKYLCCHASTHDLEIILNAFNTKINIYSVDYWLLKIQTSHGANILKWLFSNDFIRFRNICIWQILFHQNESIYDFRAPSFLWLLFCQAPNKAKRRQCHVAPIYDFR